VTDYSKFSVHDLLCEALALQEREQLMGDREPFTDAMLAEIESALRSAVIREASVGVMYLGMIQRRRRMASSIRDLPDGSYDLIPVSTKHEGWAVIRPSEIFLDRESTRQSWRNWTPAEDGQIVHVTWED
jgi:hypothetical protein